MYVHFITIHQQPVSYILLVSVHLYTSVENSSLSLFNRLPLHYNLFGFAIKNDTIILLLEQFHSIHICKAM